MHKQLALTLSFWAVLLFILLLFFSTLVERFVGHGMSGSSGRSGHGGHGGYAGGHGGHVQHGGHGGYGGVRYGGYGGSGSWGGWRTIWPFAWFWCDEDWCGPQWF